MLYNTIENPQFPLDCTQHYLALSTGLFLFQGGKDDVHEEFALLSHLTEVCVQFLLHHKPLAFFHVRCGLEVKVSLGFLSLFLISIFVVCLLHATIWLAIIYMVQTGITLASVDALVRVFAKLDNYPSVFDDTLILARQNNL